MKYLLFAIYGLSSAIAGAPTISTAVSSAYAFGWSIALTVAAILALIGSLREQWEGLEKWAAVAVVGLLSTTVVASFHLAGMGDVNRVAFSVLLVIVTLLPAARAAALIIQTTPRIRFKK